MIPDEAVDLDKGYYHGVYILLKFNKEDDIDRKGDQSNMEEDTGEEDMEDMRIRNEIERHWKMVFGDNKGGVDDLRYLKLSHLRYTRYYPRYQRI